MGHPLDDVMRCLSDLALVPASVLDVGCGSGRLAIELAKAYPSATVRGVDSDNAVLRIARRHARNQSVDNRCQFDYADVRLPYFKGLADLTCFTAVHGVYENDERLVEAMRLTTECRGISLVDGIWVAATVAGLQDARSEFQVILESAGGAHIRWSSTVPFDVLDPRVTMGLVSKRGRPKVKGCSNLWAVQFE